MNKKILTTGFVLFSFMLPLKAMAAKFTAINVFGDSLSDTGNVLNVTTALNQSNSNIPIIPPFPYFEGRFSNGRIWVEYLAQRLGLQVTPSTVGGSNFAFGGATTGTPNTIINGVLPGLQQEIGTFTSSLPNPQAADPKALYIIWAGANDYLPTISSFTPFTQPDVPLANLSKAVTDLAKAGAKTIMVVNLPPLGKLPLTSNTPLSGSLNTLTQEHNAQLYSTINQDLNNMNLNDVEIIPLDVNTLVNNVLTNPSQFGFTNTTQACLSVLSCVFNPNEQNNFLFWDQIHPTTAAHQLIGQLALRAVGVPEPASVLGILAFGALGAGAMRKRHKDITMKEKVEIGVEG